MQQTSVQANLCSSKVRTGDRLEALLARSVPELKLDTLASHVNCLCGEVDANGGMVGRGEGVVNEAADEAGLAHAWVASHDGLAEDICTPGT